MCNFLCQSQLIAVTLWQIKDTETKGLVLWPVSGIENNNVLKKCRLHKLRMLLANCCVLGLFNGQYADDNRQLCQKSAQGSKDSKNCYIHNRTTVYVT